jgi:DNA-binding CsgD family transcriptional regulator
MQQKLTLVEEMLDRMHLGIIVLTSDRKVRLATESAVKQVTNYLGNRCLRGNRLPESLWRWVKQQEITPSGKDDVLLRRSPLVLKREGKRLVIRLVSDLDQSLLLLEEQPTTIQPQSLAPFGLSPREAQVLDWLTQGKTNKEIGMILELSPRTVQKHLEHIYQKIGVESRTAATAKTYEIASIASMQTANFALLLATSLIT